MPTSFVPNIRDRLVQLTDALQQLKERVREAVASEMGRIISDSVRELLTTALRGREKETVSRTRIIIPHRRIPGTIPMRKIIGIMIPVQRFQHRPQLFLQQIGPRP